MISIYSEETVTFKGRVYMTLLMELPNDKYTRIGGESLEDALLTRNGGKYVSPLAQFLDEGIDCYISDEILESGDTEAIEKAIREVDPELFDDEPEEEPEELTWDDIYKAADGCACGEPNLRRKDFARGEIVDWFEENFGINLEREGEENVIEIVEEALDDCAERYNLVFDREGHIIGCSEVTIQDKASELVSFYDERPDRPDKDFDTLDIALNILRTITDNPNANELKSAAPKSSAVKSNKEERVLEAVRNFVDAYDKAEEVFSEYPGDINDLISEEYPFEKSFDEYGCRMQVWEGKVKDAVFHKTIEENLSKEETESSDAEEEVEPKFLEWDYQQIAKNYRLTGYIPTVEEMHCQSWHADRASATSTVKISDFTENGQALIERLRLPFGTKKPLEFITFSWSYEYGVSFTMRDIDGIEEGGLLSGEEEIVLMKDNRLKLPEIEHNYSSIEELRADEELQNMSRYAYKKVLLEGKPVFACTTNQQYEDILWGGINDTLVKFEEHFGMRGNILDVDDLTSEIRDFILDKYERREVKLVDVFTQY